eukprot:m.376387 g.376387  ORF g.376387 m.376387 type:complete len:472 (-) comp16700_c1_seq4:1888-3303(-)
MADTSTVVDHSTPIHKKVKPRVGSVFGKKGHSDTQNQEDEAESPWQGKRPPPVLSYDSEPESEDESADLSSSSGSFLAWRQRVSKNGRDDSGWSPFTVPLGALLILLAAGSFVAKSMLVHSLWPEPHASQSASVIDDSIYPPETEADLRAACSPLEYETRGVKDNACASLTRCSVGQTVVVHSTATTDRLCGQRQVEPCTPLEYRVPKGSCKALTRCTGGRVVATHSTATSDRICTPTRPGENWTANFVELARHVAAVRESISRVQGESAQSTSPIQMLTTQRGLCLTSTVVYCVIMTCILARKKKGAEQCASSPELIVTTSTQRLKSATIRNDIMVPELEMSPDRPAPRCGRLSLFANQLLDGGVEDESCTLTGLPDMSGLPHAERTRRRQSAKKESRRLVNAIKVGCHAGFDWPNLNLLLLVALVGGGTFLLRSGKTGQRRSRDWARDARRSGQSYDNCPHRKRSSRRH